MKIGNLVSFKQKALQWAAAFDICCSFDSNGYADPYGRFDLLIAAGADKRISHPAGQAFGALRSFYDAEKNWMFGLLAYDLKNETEPLSSANPDRLGFPDLFFFIPKYLLAVKDGVAEMLIGDVSVLQEITALPLHEGRSTPVKVKSKISKAQYMKAVEDLRLHILRGDVYELNYCQEFFAEEVYLDPLSVLRKLNEISPVPFSGFFKIGERYILSASPERFLCKRGCKLVSQPIKGTAKRGLDPLEDQRIRERLKQDAKEQAENVMIVDLVRNDLTKSAVKGSVKVEELFGIYAFPQVYQMISTVSCELAADVHPVEAVRNAFPMGSMTGAPKIKAMQLIEQYEFSKRGVYSGAFGYLDPAGDFDFNVVIRSILYAAENGYLSFQVGGAITYAASAAEEYEECLLKASAMMKALETKEEL